LVELNIRPKAANPVRQVIKSLLPEDID
jgi:hypothetical protein